MVSSDPGILLVVSSETWRIVGSNLCILFDDFDAFRFEKKDLDWSRTCFEVVLGDDGKGGSEVNVGDAGSMDG